MKAQPLEVLRTFMKGDFTLDLDKEATQALWDECQKAEDENSKLASTVVDALRDLIAEYEDRQAQFGDDYLWQKHEDAETLPTAKNVLRRWDEANARHVSDSTGGKRKMAYSRRQINSARERGSSDTLDSKLADIGDACSLYGTHTLRIEEWTGDKWRAESNWQESEIDQAVRHTYKMRFNFPDVPARLIRVRFEVVAVDDSNEGSNEG